MTTEFNFKMADNNLEPLEVVETTIIIHPMSDIFNTFSSIYNNYATSSSGNVTVKTFLDVDQNKFKFSNVVPMPYSSMKQEICVHDSESIEPHLIRHPGLLPGFPIPYDLLLKGINMAEKSSTKPYWFDVFSSINNLSVSTIYNLHNTPTYFPMSYREFEHDNNYLLYVYQLFLCSLISHLPISKDQAGCSAQSTQTYFRQSF